MMASHCFPVQARSSKCPHKGNMDTEQFVEQCACLLVLEADMALNMCLILLRNEEEGGWIKTDRNPPPPAHLPAIDSANDTEVMSDV